MRRTRLGVTLFLASTLLAARPGRGQGTGFGSIGNDPFTTYYAWYLPNQAYQSLQPRVEDTINAIAVQRQQRALAEREGMFDQRSRFELDEEEGLFGRYGAQRGGRAGGAMLSSTVNPFGGNLRGAGPALYFNRTGRYYPTIRAGRGPNRNIAALRASRNSGMGGMGGMGMPSMPGPR